MSLSSRKVTALSIVGGLFAIIFIFSGIQIIDTGFRGVKTRFGEVVSAEPLTEGIYFFNPITTRVVEIDTRTKVSNSKTITYTKDIQQADIAYALNYNLDPTAVIDMYKTVGLDWENKIVYPIIDASIKQIMGTYEAAPLIANRDKARMEMFEVVKKSLAEKGVTLTNLEIRNIDYSTTFENAVEAKVTATQRASEAKNRTVQVEEEAKQKIIAAKAEAESMSIRAQALTQNKSLVEYEAVQKWDGKLPQYMMGNSVPFINVNGTGK